MKAHERADHFVVELPRILEVLHRRFALRQDLSVIVLQ